MIYPPVVLFSALCTLIFAQGTTAIIIPDLPEATVEPAVPVVKPAEPFKWKATKGAVVKIKNFRNGKNMTQAEYVDFIVPGVARNARDLEFTAGPNEDGSIGFRLKNVQAVSPWTDTKTADGDPAYAVGNGHFSAQIGPDLVKCHLESQPKLDKPKAQTISFQNKGDRKVYSSPCAGFGDDGKSWVRVVCGGLTNGGVGEPSLCDASQFTT